MSDRLLIEKFSFRTPDGSDPQWDFAWETLGFTSRRSKLGNVVVRFPDPNTDLEITDGEKLGARKWERVKPILDAFTQRGNQS
jgi:hypothetical protein